MSETEDTQRLLSLAKSGDLQARGRLLTRYRPRLRRMIQSFLDPRLSARIDPSDILQNAMTQATVRLNDYLENPPIGFYPWLRQITRQELVDAHREHVKAHCRSVNKEEALQFGISDRSASALVNQLVSSGTSPSGKAVLAEYVEQIKQALAELPDADREILLMRCSEHLKASEIAEIMGISESAVRSRFFRALQNLKRKAGNHHD